MISRTPPFKDLSLHSFLLLQLLLQKNAIGTTKLATPIYSKP